MVDPETSIPTAPAPDQLSTPPEQAMEPEEVQPKDPVSEKHERKEASGSSVSIWTPPAQAMEPEEVQPKDPVSEKHEPKKASGSSLSIWPPSQRTRDAVIARLIETLSSQSVISKRYGIIPKSEAEEAARRIEEEAFAIAGGSASADDDGLEILQAYSKDISKRMLATVKERASTGEGAVDGNASESQSPSESPTTASEEKSSAETEA